jgi:hypothetical protein
MQVVFQDILKYQKTLILVDVENYTETARAKLKHEGLFRKRIFSDCDKICLSNFVQLKSWISLLLNFKVTLYVCIYREVLNVDFSNLSHPFIRLQPHTVSRQRQIELSLLRMSKSELNISYWMYLLLLIINMIIHTSVLINDNPFVFSGNLLLVHKLNILDFVNSLILMIKSKLCRCIQSENHSAKADSDNWLMI